MATNVKTQSLLACEEPLMELKAYVHALELMALGMIHDGEGDAGGAVYRIARECGDLTEMVQGLLLRDGRLTATS